MYIITSVWCQVTKPTEFVTNQLDYNSLSLYAHFYYCCSISVFFCDREKRQCETQLSSILSISSSIVDESVRHFRTAIKALNDFNILSIGISFSATVILKRRLCCFVFCCFCFFFLLLFARMWNWFRLVCVVLHIFLGILADASLKRRRRNRKQKRRKRSETSIDCNQRFRVKRETAAK